MTARFLRRCGALVLTAASGEEALAVISREPGLDCVLSDVMMPGITGIELICRLPCALRRRAVLFTASVLEVRDHQMIPDGVPVLRKPVDNSVLHDAVVCAAARI